MTTAQNPSHYNLISLKIYDAAGGVVGLEYLREELNLYQDIYSNCMSGDLVVKDTQNIISNLGLCGNEFLHVNFKTYDYTPFERYFRIYKISEVRFANATTLRYKIHFCSEEFILNQQLRISKSYNGLKCGEIVNDIVTNYLKINPSKFSYEPTTSVQKIIVPNQKPFEAINWISSFSINEKFSSAYTFFETQTGFKFVSLQKLFTTKGYTTLTINPQNILQDVDDKLRNKTSINKIEIDQAFDVLSTMANGGYSSNMLTVDLTHGKYESSTFNPVSNKIQTLNKYLPFNEATNRIGGSLISNSSYVRYFPNFQGDLTDKWLLQRAAQFALINNNRVKVAIYGDSQIEAGMVIGLDFPTITPVNSSQEVFMDRFKSGNYLVTSVKNRIYENRYTTYLELCKDSNISSVPSTNESSEYKIAKIS